MKANFLEQQYRLYYQTAYVYTVSLCKNKELAEDIVSHAFEKAFVSYKNNKNDFKYWLLLVCRNTWIDHLRKNKHLVDESIEEDRMIVKQDSVLDAIIQTEKQKVIYQNLMKLPKQYQEILVLHYYSEIPLIQIAKLLNLSDSNAKTLICRARMKLKKYLEEDGYGF